MRRKFDSFCCDAIFGECQWNYITMDDEVVGSSPTVQPKTLCWT
ncbi:MAG: hypothetical protein ABJA66_17285 [Actinomycetota bacterium]